jgi:hypothetical protein
MAQVRRDVGIFAYLKVVAYIAFGAAIGGAVLGFWPRSAPLREHQTPWVTCDELKFVDEGDDFPPFPKVYWMDHCGYIPEGVVTSD